MIQKDLQGNLWECKIGTMSSGKTIGEDLSKQIIKMENLYVDIVRKRDKEIERLNNIINELEKWLEKGIMAQDYPTKVGIICKNTLDKLKELKEK